VNPACDLNGDGKMDLAACSGGTLPAMRRVIGGLFTSTLLTLLLLPVLYEWIFEKENLIEVKKKVEEHPARA
jgi:hypothetical protein